MVMVVNLSVATRNNTKAPNIKITTILLFILDRVTKNADVKNKTEMIEKTIKSFVNPKIKIPKMFKIERYIIKLLI